MGLSVRSFILYFSITLLLCSGVVRADVEVNARQDTVVLNDGSEIECFILMMSPTGIVIIEKDPKDPEKKKQRTLSRNAIRNIVIGERSARTEELLTDTEFAQKVVLSAGARKDDSTDKKAVADGTEKHSASSKKSKSKKKDTSETDKAIAEKETAKPAEVTQGAKPPAPETIVPDAPVSLPPPALPPNELVAAYLARYPDLQGPEQDFAGDQRIQEWLQSSRQPFDALLNAYLGNVNDSKSGSPIRGTTGIRNGRRLPPEPAK